MKYLELFESYKRRYSYKNYIPKPNPSIDTDEWKLDNLKLTLGGKFPNIPTGREDVYKTYDYYVKNTEKISSEPFVCEITLKKDDIKIKATKKDRWSMWWIFEIGGETFDTKKNNGSWELTELFKKLYLSKVDIVLNDIKGLDWTYMFSDDPRSYRSGEFSFDRIKKMILELTPREQWRVYRKWNKECTKEFMFDSYNDFLRYVKRKENNPKVK